MSSDSTPCSGAAGSGEARSEAAAGDGPAGTSQGSRAPAQARPGLSVPRLAQRDSDRRARPSVLRVRTDESGTPAAAHGRDTSSAAQARAPWSDLPAPRPVAAPPGWPTAVLPMGVPGWEQSAGAWLIDQCPADYRAHPVWRRYPEALAWVASLHVDAELEAMRQAFRRVRVELADYVTPEAVAQIRHALESEGLRLRAVQRGIELVSAALRGEVYVPRL